YGYPGRIRPVFGGRGIDETDPSADLAALPRGRGRRGRLSVRPPCGREVPARELPERQLLLDRGRPLCRREVVGGGGRDDGRAQRLPNERRLPLRGPSVGAHP